jgi:hypothetical protein
MENGNLSISQAMRASQTDTHTSWIPCATSRPIYDGFDRPNGHEDTKTKTSGRRTGASDAKAMNNPNDQLIQEGQKGFQKFTKFQHHRAPYDVPCAENPSLEPRIQYMHS